MMHQAISTVKFKALCKRLNLPLYETVGLLEALWLFAQIQAKDGDLTRFTPLEIAGWLDWQRDENEMVEALVETRWLDRDETGLRIHDWSEHKPNYLKAVEAREKVRKTVRDAHANCAAQNAQMREPGTEPGTEPGSAPGTVLGTEPGRVHLTQPNLTRS